MIKPCHVCGVKIDDHKDGRYTVRGLPYWYCSRICAGKGTP